MSITIEQKNLQLTWNDGVEQKEYSIKNQIEEMLLLAGNEDKDGIRRLLNHMENIGFYEMPCSGGNHLAKIGGLAEHSLNVTRYALSLLNGLV